MPEDTREQIPADATANKTDATPPNPGELLAQAVRHHSQGQLGEAEKRYREILTLNPHHAKSLHLLGHIGHETGRPTLAVEMASRAIAAISGEEAYAASLRVEAHNILGISFQALKKLRESEDSFRKAIALDPEFVEAQVSLGSVLREQGRLDEAKESFCGALILRADDVGANAGLGDVLRDQGDLMGALACYRRALFFRPDLGEVHNNLGNVLKDLGQPAEAEAHYRNALTLMPELIQASNNLAVALWHQDKLEEAEEILARLSDRCPGYVMALENLAGLLSMKGDVAGAMQAIRKSLKISETPRAKGIFVDVIRNGQWTGYDDNTRALMTRVLTDPWGRPGDLARIATDFIKLDRRIGACIARAMNSWPAVMSEQELYGFEGPAFLGADTVLCALLGTAQNIDFELELLLTSARRLLLKAATGDSDPEEGGALSFLGALARQCFINEYVFSQSDDEIRQCDALGVRLTEMLASNTDVPALWVIAFAAYRPLGSLPCVDRLLERRWPDEITAILTQQIAEPRTEVRMRVDIPRLTVIVDEISRSVREQYEEHPYPRWVKTMAGEKMNSISGHLSRKFPLVRFERQGTGMDNTVPDDILIAGCGTGQQSIEAAQRFADARVLAVDLSLSSLAYARRKSLELGLENISYAQADILEFAALDNRFHAVEAMGVLHHMSDPLAAWETLLSLLHPGGFMRVGLYSQVARRDILRARRFIAARGYEPVAGGIRQLRQDIIAERVCADFAPLLNLPDFFGISTCRDLLFHVHEHNLTLAEIDDFLRARGLIFLGFEIGNVVLHDYRKRFSDDLSATQLGHWQAFENDNPDTFSGMYQFWIQKPH